MTKLLPCLLVSLGACGRIGFDDESLTMSRVAAGDFTMGCVYETDRDCKTFERPAHQVTLSAFRIDETEVSQGAYRECVDAGACAPPPQSCVLTSVSPAHPMACVSWAQAQAFCAWRDARLPTEAEWEKAARGTDARLYPWGDTAPTCELANYDLCGLARTLESASDVPGAAPYGELGLAGNVSEWVADYWALDTYDPARSDYSAIDPTGPATGSFRVIRGGNFLGDQSWLRGASRTNANPDVTINWIGFRCAR